MSRSACIPMIVAVLAAACLANATRAEEVKVGQHPQSYDSGRGLEMGYLVYVPEAYPASGEAWPLMVFLHGSGERGSDLNLVAKHGPPMLVARAGKDLPFIIVSPQCPTNVSWTGQAQIQALDGLIDDLQDRYRIDEDRIYLTGLSMGGFGTWSLAAAFPDRFAALVPICGGGHPGEVGRLAHVPVWVFHGAKDQAVGLEKSEDMVAALNAVGGNVKFTVYPEARHDSWTETYNNPELYAWLLQHARPGPAE